MQSQPQLIKLVATRPKTHEACHRHSGTMIIEKIRSLPACCLCSRNAVTTLYRQLTAQSRSQSVAWSDVLVSRASSSPPHIPRDVKHADFVAYFSAPAAELGRFHSSGGGRDTRSGKECVPDGRTKGPVQKCPEHHAISITCTPKQMGPWQKRLRVLIMFWWLVDASAASTLYRGLQQVPPSFWQLGSPHRPRYLGRSCAIGQ